MNTNDFTETLNSLPEVSTITLDHSGDIFALVDQKHYSELSRYKWRYVWDKHGRKCYACRNGREKGKQKTIYMHKEVLRLSGKRKPAPAAAHHIGDHKNGNSLDNRESNLRWATRSKNNANRGFDRCPKGRFKPAHSTGRAAPSSPDTADITQEK